MLKSPEKIILIKRQREMEDLFFIETNKTRNLKNRYFFNSHLIPNGLPVLSKISVDDRDALSYNIL